MTTSKLPSHGKRIACVLLALLLSPLLAELLLRLDGYDGPATRDEIQALVDRTLGEQANQQSEPQKRRPQTRELHPYYGYDQIGGQGLVDRYVRTYHAEDRSKKFIVMVCGGSVAEIFVGSKRGGSQRLVELLSEDARIGGRPIAIQRLARAGYKQPQQLQKLAYFLARGCVPDLVLNFDGLNEVRLAARNARAGLPISFPSSTHWNYLVQSGTAHIGLEEPMARTFVAREAFLDSADQTLGGQFLSSALLGSWLRSECNRRFTALVDAESKLSTRLAERSNPEVTGPISEQEQAAALQEAVLIWAESSKMMQAMCEARGALYIHLLQPTLHDPGSKIISPEEHETGVGAQGLAPELGTFYDALRARGAELASEGVNFVDLSRVFAGMSETLYYDRAHVGRAGNLILAERFAEEIKQRLAP